MRARKMVLSGLMVVLLFGLVGCGGDGEGDSDGVLGADRVENADLVIGDEHPFYDPKDLTIPLNREVTFTVLNEGKKIHNLTIPGLNIDRDVAPGQSIEITLPAATAPRDGFFTVFCKFHQFEGEATRLNIQG